MHPVFSIAVYKRPRHRAFGLDLQPLTLGHIFLLREYRSAVFPGVKGCNLGHVLMACFICSSRHALARKYLQSRKLDRFIARWAKVSREFDLEAECGKFFAYFHESFSCPEVKVDSKASAGPEATVPEEWKTLAFLMAELHMSREEAYDQPLSFATALWAAQGERTGRLEFRPYGLDLALEAAWQRQHEIDLATQRAAEKGEQWRSA